MERAVDAHSAISVRRLYSDLAIAAASFQTMVGSGCLLVTVMTAVTTAACLKRGVASNGLAGVDVVVPLVAVVVVVVVVGEALDEAEDVDEAEDEEAAIMVLRRQSFAIVFALQSAYAIGRAILKVRVHVG